MMEHLPRSAQDYLDHEKKLAELRKEIMANELYEFGIYVQDYDLFISKQISDVLPLIKAIPRLSFLDDNEKLISIAS